jgi:uncharacterized protein (TIGR03435 family)
MTTLSFLGPAAANHLWQSTAFAATVWMMTLLLRGNSAQIRYLLWLAASAKFIVPFSLLIGLGSLIPRRQHVVAGAETAMYSALDAVGQPFSAIAMGMPSEAVHTSMTQSFLHALPATLLAVWFCGVVAVLLVWYGRWRQVAATLRRAVPMETGREVEILRRIDSRGEIALLLSRELLEPGIFGIFRPVLIWPERLSDRLEDEHIEAILTHERLHVQRHDNLIAVLHMVVEAAFWFHPMVWWMERHMVEERELACDEAVVEMGSSPETYAESLLKACKFCLESPLSCVSGITGADLKKRIVQIMTKRVARKLDVSKKLLHLAMGSVAIAAPIVFGQMNAAQSAVQQNSIPDWQKNAGEKMAFEVASIHPSKPGQFTYPNFPISNDDSYTSAPNNNFVAGFNLVSYIQFAYKLRLSRDEMRAMLANQPGCVLTDAYVIRAKAEHNVTKDQLRLMMQSLLTDRFKLAVHFETKEVPVLALTLVKPGKLGPRLRPHAEGPPCDRPDDKVFPYHCDSYGFRKTPDNTFMEGSRNTTMSLLATSLTSLPGVSLGRPVVDQSGLSGKFDFTLEWMPESNSSVPSDTGAASDPQGPTMQEALKEQLGLELKSTRAPLKVLVIDHVERPSEN